MSSAPPTKVPRKRATGKAKVNAIDSSTAIPKDGDAPVARRRAAAVKYAEDNGSVEGALLVFQLHLCLY